MISNVTNKATKNSFGLIFSQLLSKVVSLFAFILLAKYLSVENFGLYNYAFAFWTIIASVLEGGLGVYATREIARDPKSANHYFLSMILIKILFGSVIFSIIYFLGQFQIIFTNPNEFRIILVFGVSVLLNQSMWYSIISVSRGLQYFKIEMLTTFLNSLLNSFAIFAALYFHLNLFHFVILTVIANVLLILFTVTYFNKINKIKFVIELPNIIKFLKSSIPLSIAYILGNTNLRIGTLLLSYFAGDAALGIFSASSRFLFQSMFIVSASLITLYPIFSNYYKKDVQKINLISTKYIKLLLLISAPTIIFISLFAKDITVLLFENKYLGTEIVLKYMTLWFFIWGLKSFSVIILQSIDKEKKIINQSLLGILFNVLFCIFLIPGSSFVGLSLAMVFSESIMLLYGFYFLIKYGIIRKLFTLFGAPVIFLVVFLVFYQIFFYPGNFSDTIIMFLFSLLLYFPTMYFSKYFQFAMIQRFFKNNYRA